MTMLDVHRAALSDQVASHHEFLLRYGKSQKVVYGFVEGKEDPCFYRTFVELLLPDDWNVELWPVGSKTNVYKIYDLFDWRSFKKNQICFFVDRDLSDLIPETLQTDKNIYVTTGYSIELDLVNKDVCKRVLSELLGFAHADHDELEAVGELFEAQYELFRLELLPVMSWILNWRRLRLKASLNNIEMKDLFAIKDGRLQALANPDGQSNAAVYIHKKCSLVFDPSIDIEPLKVEMFSANNYRKFARGKFAMWFLIEFCNTTHRDRVSLFPSLARTPRVSVPIGPSNGMALIAPRGRLPLALREFIDQTYVAFSAIQS